MSISLKTIEDVEEYIANGAKRYGGKNKFLSSAEYREVYPIIERIYSVEKTARYEQSKNAADTAMSEAGAAYGDRVEYTLIGSFFNTETLKGTLVNRSGLPMVKLDEKHNGKRYVKWHKGWRKM